MDLSDIQPINNEKALFIKNKKILVVADLHIGIESELKEQGINLNSQTQKMIINIENLCKKFKPQEIVLLGDIKHNIPFSTNIEQRDVKTFLSKAQELGKTHIIPGNHDGNIHRFASNDINIHSSQGLIIENIGFIHGHRWPKKEIFNCEQIIMGHTHPTIMFSDRLEHMMFEPCWVKSTVNKKKLKEKYPEASCKKILIVPAFNSLCGGIAINKDGFKGPLGKILDIKNSEIYLIDGTFLGKIKDFNKSG
jgi:uncharacterized protein